MGTRHLIAVVVDGEYKVAQYGQWDGYPSGQGINLLEALRDIEESNMMNVFRDYVRNVQYITTEDLKQLWIDCGADQDTDFVPMDVAEYPHLSRDCGSDIIKYIIDTQGNLKTSYSLDFASDSLFCEYAYVIDLDYNTFEVYKGFVKEPHTGERFSNFDLIEMKDYVGAKQYYPVKHMQTFDLFDLPSNEMFLEILEPQDDNNE